MVQTTYFYTKSQESTNIPRKNIRKLRKEPYYKHFPFVVVVMAVAPSIPPPPDPYFLPKTTTCSLSYPASTPAPATARRMFAPAPLKSDLGPSFLTICLNASNELLYFTASPEVIIILLRTVSMG
ncbi:hypothetical protein OIU84_027892 [Salix udensis]|uniref:Uncharacterized protein n=1 Tax=Salix udensis TaxID=889485 RepID=A0AAD6KBE0_9ROSI|nr:hypothetical protein OIU84_027892 [Salix udensis]